MITAGRAARPGEQGGAHTRAASVTATATSTTLPRCWRRTGATTRPTAWAASRTRTGSAGATRTPRPGRRRRSTPSCAAPCAGLLAGPADARAPCGCVEEPVGCELECRCAAVLSAHGYSTHLPAHQLALQLTLQLALQSCPPAYPPACPPGCPLGTLQLPSSLPSSCPPAYPPAALQLAAGRRTPPHRTGVRASPAG